MENWVKRVVVASIHTDSTTQASLNMRPHTPEMMVHPCPISLPCTLGSYQLERLEGEGGSAWVFFGHHLNQGNPVAIKILKNKHHSEDLVRSFLDQGQRLIGLKSPLLPEILEFGNSVWGPWWAMTWIEGLNLSELLAKGTQWGSAGVYHLVHCCCEALNTLHQANIIHGDVKPENLIYVGPPQNPLQAKLILIDPSLTRSHEITPPKDLPLIEYTQALTQGSSSSKVIPFIFGTPAYMSPEQLKGEVLTPASDLYSLGVLLYQLTTGVCPFLGDLNSLIQDKLSRPIPPPSVRHRPWPYPAALEALILNLLSRTPATRLQSVAEVQSLLKTARDKDLITPSTPSNAPWLSQTEPGSLHVHHPASASLTHLNFDTEDQVVTISDTIRALSKEEIEPFKPQAVSTRRATEERLSTRPSLPSWLYNLLWLSLGAFIAIVIMKLIA